MAYRQLDFDVTNSVRVSDPQQVCAEVQRILEDLYQRPAAPALSKAFDTFAAVYAGVEPGYVGCDTPYHDTQHSLDVTLAMARLVAGHERSCGSRDRLGPRRSTVGVICALFHDIGYVRHTDEAQVHCGAELTAIHVTRSGCFISGFLRANGFAREAAVAAEMVQYTGYEKPLDQVAVIGARDRRLGFLLATADLIAQMADRAYPEKCRDFLYREFEACGIAGAMYTSPDDLLRKTPDFVGKVFRERLDGYFEGVYRYFEAFFGGQNPYLEQIRRHLAYTRTLVENGQQYALRRHPVVVDAQALRKQLLDIPPAAFVEKRRPDSPGARLRRGPRRPPMAAPAPVRPQRPRKAG